MIREVLLEMIEYENFTFLVSFCDQVHLHLVMNIEDKSYYFIIEKRYINAKSL